MYITARAMLFTITCNNRDTLTVYNDSIDGNISIDDFDSKLECLLTCICYFEKPIYRLYEISTTMCAESSEDRYKCVHKLFRVVAIQMLHPISTRGTCCSYNVWQFFLSSTDDDGGSTDDDGGSTDDDNDSVDGDDEETIDASEIVNNGESESPTFVPSKHLMNYDCYTIS